MPVPTTLLWLRRDLRLHDHPALTAAAAGGGPVVPVFVVDAALLRGRFASGNRTAFLLGCLHALDAGLRDLGARLVVRTGPPHRALAELAVEVGAREVHWSRDVSPHARRREAEVTAALAAAGVRGQAHPGVFVVDDVDGPRTAAGTPHRLFTPYWRAWERVGRRTVLAAPRSLPTIGGIDPGRLHGLEELGLRQDAETLPEPGEPAARAAMRRWLSGGIGGYPASHDRLGGGTSELSAHLHLGCLSARELEAAARTAGGEGGAAFTRQLCWRDFFGHVLLHHPAATTTELQERRRGMRWDGDPDHLRAWCEGRTGYPLVDAGMRQLRRTGWMHNRARLVVGSFLTKDLHLDWRLGEAHFMRLLVDGDVAQNNGNWQWIGSVGADPAPVFKRILNPTLQQRRHDPEGVYVRRWVPELERVPLEHLAEPWRMSDAEQRRTGCVLGHDYPWPVVDHAAERRVALDRYRAAV